MPRETAITSSGPIIFSAFDCAGWLEVSFFILTELDAGKRPIKNAD